MSEVYNNNYYYYSTSYHSQINYLCIFYYSFLRHQLLILSIILSLNTVCTFYFNYRLDFDMWCIDNCQELETGMLSIYVCFLVIVIRNLTCKKWLMFFFPADHLNVTRNVPTAHSTHTSTPSCHELFSCATRKEISHFPALCMSIFSFYLSDRLSVAVLSCLSCAVDVS